MLDPAQMQAITDAGRLTFHLLGDVGGVKAPQDQQIVALNLTADAHRATDPARFAYIMGDVVYHNGDDAQYYPQFYEPYADYPCPIFSVPGNHDGTPSPGTSSLQAWMANFATPAPGRAADARDVPRLTMTQPDCYWTLTSPWSPSSACTATSRRTGTSIPARTPGSPANSPMPPPIGR